ncbi:MAG: hypothetical protein L0Y70_23330 [Gemmataceae bacterium]|nr:hypothetical protein [Gemmataceae bacterium]
MEAFVHGIDAVFSQRGERETWIQYEPLARTQEASVWLLFPQHRPYQSYRLISLPKKQTDPPTPPLPVDTQYTIDHPYGDVIAWTVINPKVGNVYQCRWEWKK